MSIRHNLIVSEAKRIAKGESYKIRRVSSHIGKQLLYNILQDIDMLEYDSGELKEFSKSSVFSKYANPTYYFDTYKNTAFAPSKISQRERIIRSALYSNMKVFDALKYSLNKVKGSPLANSLLINIFRPSIVINTAYIANSQLYVYDYIMNKYKDELPKIIRQVYEEREKWVTGISTKSMRIEMSKIDDKYPFGVYFQLVSSYANTRPVGYYNRLMDIGTYTESDIPTIGQIYGWIKRRQAAGKWRPFVLVGWRNRINKYGQLQGDTYLAKKPPNPVDKEASPGTAAYVIMLRMKRRFEKRGRLSPFGSFAKYNKRNTIYKTSIFTEIFNIYVEKFESTVTKKEASIKKEVEDNFKLKLVSTIKHIKKGTAQGLKEVKSLNYMIKKFNITSIDDYSVHSEYKSTELRSLVMLANKLNLLKRKWRK